MLKLNIVEKFLDQSIAWKINDSRSLFLSFHYKNVWKFVCFFYVKMELKDFGNGVIKYGRIKIVV